MPSLLLLALFACTLPPPLPFQVARVGNTLSVWLSWLLLLLLLVPVPIMLTGCISGRWRLRPGDLRFHVRFHQIIQMLWQWRHIGRHLAEPLLQLVGIAFPVPHNHLSKLLLRLPDGVDAGEEGIQATG